MASNTSVKALRLTQSTSLLPFLYQTKTLRSFLVFSSPALQSRTFRTTSQTSIRNNKRHHGHEDRRPKPYRDGAETADIESIPVSRCKEVTGSGQEAVGVIRRVPFPVPKLNDESKDIVWEEDPREIQATRKGYTTAQHGLNYSEDVDFLSIQDPLTGEDNLLSDELQVSGNETASISRPRESTITISERETFDRIFADIAARSSRPNTDDEFMLSTATENQSSSARTKKAKESLDDIMQDALKTNSRDYTASQQRAELTDAVKQFPQALRAKAAEALGMRLGGSKLMKSEEADEMEQLRQPERERVEALMRAAKSDVQLWKVMEEEVFSLVGKLGLEVSAPAPKVIKKRKTKKAAKEAESAEPVDDHADPVDSSQLNLYGPLYPSYLLLGLRLLDRSFAKPSHMVLNILPRIKSLGIISHVLGGSTPLYNELLRIYRTRFDDFGGMVSLLTEMERAGLNFDEETLRMVNDAIIFKAEANMGRMGNLVRAIIGSREFMPGAFDTWAYRIRESINGQGDSLSFGRNM